MLTPADDDNVENTTKKRKAVATEGLRPRTEAAAKSNQTAE